MTIERLGLDDLPETLQELLRPRVERLGYLGEFFQAAGHQPEALAGFVAFTEALKQAMPASVTELVALTVSCELGNIYERNQHERLSLKLGLSIEWIADDSIGVWLVGLPVTARIDAIGASPSNTVNTAAAMFTCTRLTGSSRGSQRQRSILAMIESMRAATGTLNSASVRASSNPVGFSP